MTAQIEKTRTDNTSYHSYQEADHFEISGRPIFSVLDFWKYCYGDLASQSPAIAEFLGVPGKDGTGRRLTNIVGVIASDEIVRTVVGPCGIQ